ncbi:MAG: hypothetical protein CMO55_21605 [Verrucomicrobiales bacterium]|nr:hypothetical protein [Verrucomicrobiales bacterium]
MRNLKHRKSRERGSALIEIAVSYGVLVTIAVLTLKASVNASTAQMWTVKQAMTDAFVTRESALASRYPFDEVTGDSSLWALYPSTSASTVTVGKLPGGAEVTAKLYRTRIPDSNNLPSAGGSGTSTTNPGGTEAWKLQSVLAYTVGDKEYVKTRTTLRTR